VAKTATALKKPTYKQIRNKRNELTQLIAEHRMVAIEMGEAERISCTAIDDIPLYGIAKGQKFDLVKSSFEGFAYIVVEGANGHECSCVGHEKRHTCKHADLCNEHIREQYYAKKHESREDAMVLEPMSETAVRAILATLNAVEKPVSKPISKVPTSTKEYMSRRESMLNVPLNGNQGFQFYR
jgi:hypothetical protein